MVKFKNGDMYHEVEISISEAEIIEELPLDDVVNSWGSEEVLAHIDFSEIIEYLSKNGYQIAEEQ